MIKIDSPFRVSVPFVLSETGGSFMVGICVLRAQSTIRPTGGGRCQKTSLFESCACQHRRDFPGFIAELQPATK